VITASLAELDPIAEALAGAGYFAFAAISTGIADLCKVAAFDLIIVQPGVGTADREALRRIQPPDRLVELDTDALPALVACATEHLPRTN
jgi:hypothetical protein